MSVWVTLLWSASQCVYFIRPNTLLLCIFLFCIFLLYCADSQVEVQIRILLKDKYRKSCQKCKHCHSHFDFLNNAYWVSLFWRNNLLAKICFSWDPNFRLLRISFLYCIDLHPCNHYRFWKISRPFCASRNWWIIVVFIQSNSLTITIVSQKYWDILQPYSRDRFSKNNENFLCKWKLENNCSIPSTHVERKITGHSHKHSLTLYPSLSPYRWTESQMEKQIDLLRMGWRNFFPVVLLSQFLVLAGNRFWFYILLMYLEYNTVVLLC